MKLLVGLVPVFTGISPEVPAAQPKDSWNMKIEEHFCSLMREVEF
jgi:hypothetical protein